MEEKQIYHIKIPLDFHFTFIYFDIYVLYTFKSEEMKRRRFIASTALAGVASVGLAMNTSPKQAKFLLHHVFFWLKNPNATADKAQLIEGLKTLAAIPTVKQIHMGLLASTEKREVVDTSWDVSELLFFEDEKGQKTYQDHPIHQDFVKKYSHLWQKVVVYDAIDV